MIKNFFLDLIFPRFCLGCQKELDLKQASFICEACFNKITLNDARYHKKTNLDEIWSAGKYQDPILREVIHQFKYQSIESLKKPLAELIVNFLRKENLLEKIRHGSPTPGSSGVGLPLPITVLIPIPLTWRRKLSRGFNQSELLAKELSSILNCPVVNLLKRKKFNAPQARIDEWKKRKENISGAFEISLKSLKKLSTTYPLLRGSRTPVKINKAILVDDVTTSGATLEEAASVLRKAGIKEVYGLVVAN